MVMLSSTLKGRVLRFHSDAVSRNKLLITSIEGREAISQPYRFEMELVSSDPAIDAKEVLRSDAHVGIKQGVELGSSGQRGIRTLKIHGMLTEFVQCEKMEWVVYRAVLVPRLSKLSFTQQTRVFMYKSVPEMVEEILTQAGFAKTDYEFRLSQRTYPRREYVVQFHETDLDFVSRLLEHEGIFYFFDQRDDREAVVFGDSDGAYESIPGNPAIQYNFTVEAGGSKTDWFRAEQIHKLEYRRRRIQSEVVIQDFNYRSPSVPLKSTAPVVEDGIGFHYMYGEHYKNQEEGKELARVRAEELSCREELFEGGGEARALRAGLTFQLTEHYREGIDGEYLVTEIRHKAEQAISLDRIAAPVAFYRNEFVAIPASKSFRPGRRTPKPRVNGLLNARIDSGGSGQYAEIDDQGRYKVQLPFDLSGKGSGKASRYCRMGQPYAGGGMGMHFPLHKGTEIILAHVNGDPDRPIIVAAVTNPETASPVTGGNNTQCVITSGGQNTIVIEDTEAAQRMYMASPCPGAGTFVSFGASNK